MSAMTNGKKGIREEEREKTFAQSKLNLTCMFSKKEHLLMNTSYGKQFVMLQPNSAIVSLKSTP